MPVVTVKERNSLCLPAPYVGHLLLVAMEFTNKMILVLFWHWRVF